MLNFKQTEELTCATCNKPFTFTRLLDIQFEQNGCNCIPPRMAIEKPKGSFLCDLGGLLVVRYPKNSA